MNGCIRQVEIVTAQSEIQAGNVESCMKEDCKCQSTALTGRGTPLSLDRFTFSSSAQNTHLNQGLSSMSKSLRWCDI